MAVQVDEQAGRLGMLIRRMRREQELTLKQLAARTGLSHPFLSQVERGRARASFGSLDAIARGLGTTQFALFAKVADTDENATHGTARVADGEAHTFRGDFGRFDPIELLIVDTEFRDYYSHIEDEFCYLLEGTAWLDLDGELHLLRAGDAILVPSNAKHRWKTADGRPFRQLFIKNLAPQEDP